MKSVPIRRSTVRLHPDRSRVLLRPFLHSSDPSAQRICAHVMALSERTVRALWQQVQVLYRTRHARIEAFFQHRFEQVRPCLPTGRTPSRARRLLLGAYFSHEYSIEAAALFNPSIVPHPDQTRLPRGALRFVLSLRATGEGHLSSIVFRTGILDARGAITLRPRSRFCVEPAQVSQPSYEKALFARQLRVLGLVGDFGRHSLRDLPDVFTVETLRASVQRAAQKLRARRRNTAHKTIETIMLAYANYDVKFAPESKLSERVLFPATPAQRNGIEDARFVRFQDDDGTRTYYATYTAYDGRQIRPELIETRDFLQFGFSVLNGAAVRNKGMALFPRKIQGRYVMLGRQDAANLYVMFSDQLRYWPTKHVLLKPEFPWEFSRLGNCGSPIETEAGWLVLTHGVGAMRRYSIGALLLDRENPSRVLGRSREPLIEPTEKDRDGYVPNVVYSCGSILHGRKLIIPYAMSDYATTFATLSLDAVLATLAR